jgi:hypothetical protein
MTTHDYDALLEERRLSPEAIRRRREAEQLADKARNLASLTALAEAEAAPEAAPKDGDR